MNKDSRNIFIYDDETEKEETEIVSVSLNAEPKRIKTQRTVAQRSTEDYNKHIQSSYYETHINQNTGEEYKVKVTVLEPEVNPLETMRPVYAYSSNH